jgi:tetratricopeptide (TPR) repeat protein
MDFDDYVSRGTAFFEEKKYERALDNFEAAFQLRPDNTDVRQKLVVLYDLLADQAAADEAKLRAANLGIDISDIDKVIGEWAEEFKRNPNEDIRRNLAKAYYTRGVTFTSKREFSRAVEDYNEAIKLVPDYNFALIKCGQANKKIGNYDQAVKDFEKLVQYNPDDDKAKQDLAQAYSDRGIEYHKKKDYAHAISDYETALKFDPDNNTNRELLKFAKADMQKWLATEDGQRWQAEEKQKAEAEALKAKEKAEAEALKAKEKAETEALKKKEIAEAEALRARKKSEAEALKAKKEAAGKRRNIILAICAVAVVLALIAFVVYRQTGGFSKFQQNDQGTVTIEATDTMPDTFQPTHKVVTNDGSNLRLREEQGLNSAQIGTLEDGIFVKVLDTGASMVDSDGYRGNWTYVTTSDGRTGWCFGAYLQPIR